MNLPWLGLGLSANLDARATPDPWRIHARRPELFDFVEYSAALALQQARATAPGMRELEQNLGTLPAVFHPVHLNLYGPHLEGERALQALDEQLRAIGSPWVGNDVGWWHVNGTPFPGYLYLPPVLDEGGLADAVAHALHVQAALSVPLLLENPACMARRGPLHVLRFMAELHARTGLELILDLGHLFAFQLSAGLPLDAGLDDFPLDAVVELHLAGGVVTARGERRFYADDHGQPVREELFALLESLLPKLPRLRAVCFEGDGHPEHVAVATLERLRALVPPFARDPIPARAATQAPAPLGNPARHWKCFDALWCEREVPEDPEGHRAETDYRLAILADALDRTFPLTRLLAAGARAPLLAFARSAEFRNLFDGSGRELAQVFAAFVRRRLREQPEPGLEAALAFESWVLAQAARPSDPHLAPGVRVMSFPSDLSELHFAARALERHLAGRAWGSDRWESSALDSVAQASKRLRPGPWWVALRRGELGPEVVPLDVELLDVLRLASSGTAVANLAADPRWADAAHRAQQLGLLPVR